MDRFLFPMEYGSSRGGEMSDGRCPSNPESSLYSMFVLVEALEPPKVAVRGSGRREGEGLRVLVAYGLLSALRRSS